MSNVRSKSAYWNETWDLALQALRANKLRAALTMLGVIIGSGCIVLVVTVALAGKRYIIAQIEGVGSNLVYAGVMRSNNSSRLTLGDEISLADMEAMKIQVPQVAVTAGASDIPMTVVAAGVERPVKLVGVTEGFQQIRRLVVFRGRYFDPDDMVTHAKVCLLTQELAARVFPNQNPVGQEIRVGELRFSVIGVFRERISTFGETEIARESVLVPFGLMTYYTGTDYLRTLYVQADSPEAVPAVTQQVREILKGRHRPGAEYEVENLTSLLESARMISQALTVLLVVIALIALTISGIGIMNIMLVTVTERTREIGIRKAVGAPRDAILYQFLMEAFLISGTGAVIGIVIAVSIPVAINLVLRVIPEAVGIRMPVSWVSVVLAFVVSCSTGILFGYLPASRAASLHPTDSLRYE
ncbi:MAG TPA: ABC transporter permease [Candidatus Dormibacteraeota bacterium]|nr:ABC transporter permease [Candidatus Dormibacteraeota bacterium]